MCLIYGFYPECRLFVFGELISFDIAAFDDMRQMKNALNIGESDEIVHVAKRFYGVCSAAANNIVISSASFKSISLIF